ncbi:MgtC/SapB family protein [Lysobacter enzymogenes]|uniref:MgtC/SapB family protein n=1 Tax=Lysobacter enzymogenes TaxID=69 RepID=UPI00099DB595|nr:DUF4010 domain-containing protein [Lysobacter enzymogenes]UZW61924.1 DUF4010 domain-containing protein [Lysobacter enzymogenes]
MAPVALPSFIGLGVALAVGLLVGLERERAHRVRSARQLAGIRSFALSALIGATAVQLGEVGLLVAGATLGALVVAGYLGTRRRDPGLTTEAAWLLTFLIGALAMRTAAVSAALGVALAILLAARERLHRFSRHWIGHEELRGLLLLAACAFIVLPLLPDRSLDPWGAINPHQLWTLAVGVMTVSAGGYLASRVFGARAGLPIAGLAGGFVSSTATVATMADRARIQPSLAPLAASAALMSNIATVMQLALVLGVFSPALLAWATPALAGAGLGSLAAAWLAARAVAPEAGIAEAAAERPYDPWSALRLSALLAGVLIAASLARAWLGAGSLPWVLTLAGLADVHAAAAAAAQTVAHGGPAGPAQCGLLGAFAVNGVVKCLVAVARGGRAYAWRVVAGVAGMQAAFVLGAAMASR